MKRKPKYLNLQKMRFLTKRISGQALYFALLVATIGALSLVGILLLSHTSHFFELQSNSLNDLLLNNREALLQKNKEHTLITHDTITTFGVDKVSHKFYRSYYGCWKKSYLESAIKPHKTQSVGLVGNKTNEQTPNLYLKNSNSPLILVGNTKIKGNAYIPKSGIRPGIIHGNYYNGKALVQGRKRISNDELPPLSEGWLSYVTLLSSGSFLEKVKRSPLKSIMKNSFTNETLIIEAEGEMHLWDHKLSGNIIIRSHRKIVVHSNTKIEDIILVAPVIEVKSNVKGSFQAFATKSIHVKKGASLSFPSALVVDTRKQKEKQDSNINTVAIEIEGTTTVEGSIVYLEKKEKERFRSSRINIKIDENSALKGEVYCLGSIEFLGKLEGALYTDQCVVNGYGSRYINHLYNCSISPFPTVHYGGLPFKNSKQLLLSKWLY